jgi:hypothetical protein
MTHFDEMARRIQWSKNEFSHNLALEPTRLALSGLRCGLPLFGSRGPRGTALGR